MRLLGLLIALGVMSAIFSFIERRPAPPRHWKDRSVRTDIVFWFFTLVTKTFTTVVLIAALVTVASALGFHIHLSTLQNLFVARGPIARQTRWLQGIEMLFLSDGLGYWMHRLFHRERLWPFHVVHHGSEHLDWLSSVRVHPVNEALTRIAQVVPLFLLGFDPRVLTAAVPVFTIYALLLHSNDDWSFGILKYAIATPAFHRWHHAAEAEALNKNFAGLFSFWDLMFGTFYMPSHPPRRFGLLHNRLQAGLWPQIVSPFRSALSGGMTEVTENVD
jgi:sterol desaturase/sphingolipid hydroxylase (fatty acid hydroxylase superfamily)